MRPREHAGAFDICRLDELDARPIAIPFDLGAYTGHFTHGLVAMRIDEHHGHFRRFAAKPIVERFILSDDLKTLVLGGLGE